MKFGQKLVYMFLKSMQKEVVGNIAASLRKLIPMFWRPGANIGVRGFNLT